MKLFWRVMAVLMVLVCMVGCEVVMAVTMWAWDETVNVIDVAGIALMFAGIMTVLSWVVGAAIDLWDRGDVMKPAEERIADALEVIAKCADNRTLKLEEALKSCEKAVRDYCREWCPYNSRCEMCRFNETRIKINQIVDLSGLESCDK